MSDQYGPHSSGNLISDGRTVHTYDPKITTLLTQSANAARVLADTLIDSDALPPQHARERWRAAFAELLSNFDAPFLLSVPQIQAQVDALLRREQECWQSRIENASSLIAAQQAQIKDLIESIVDGRAFLPSPPITIQGLTQSQVDALVAAERERCERAADAVYDADYRHSDHQYMLGCRDAATAIAVAVRKGK